MVRPRSHEAAGPLSEGESARRGGEGRQEAAGLPGRGRVVRLGQVGEVEGVQPVGAAAAQLVGEEVVAHVREGEAVLTGRGLLDAVEEVDALVDLRVRRGGQPDAEGAELVEDRSLWSCQEIGQPLAVNLGLV